MRALSGLTGRIFVLRWQPGRDTAVALLTAVAMTAVYYTGTHARNALVAFLVFVFFGNLILNVLFPAYYVLVVRGEGLEGIGITTGRWWLAGALSVVFAASSFPELQELAAQNPDVDLLPHLLVNGLVLWEPFFVHGWLQLRFERAFGIAPGIGLAALSFGAYHLGTFPPAGVVALVGFGILYGVLFRVAGANLLVLWPLTWAVGSGIGTLQGGFGFGWSSVPGAAILLIVQIFGIALLARYGGRRKTLSFAGVSA